LEIGGRIFFKIVERELSTAYSRNEGRALLEEIGG
jgi:hypothetical protein